MTTKILKRCKYDRKEHNGNWICHRPSSRCLYPYNLPKKSLRTPCSIKRKAIAEIEGKEK